PGTSIPEEINFNHFTCCGQNDDDQTIASDFESFVTANGLPDYSYVELFNDHPGTFQDIPKNDSVTKQVTDFIMGNAAFKDNTMIVVTEDDTQNGNNGPDHVSNTFRVPMVVVASPTFMKQGFVTHVAYTTNNVLAAMERVMENNHPGIIDPNDNVSLATFPMTTADQAGLGDPLEDLWIQGAPPLSATATRPPATANAPHAADGQRSAARVVHRRGHRRHGPVLLQLELRRRVDEHGPEPQPHLHRRRQLRRDPHGHRQLVAGEDGDLDHHHHGQRRRQPD